LYFLTRLLTQSKIVNLEQKIETTLHIEGDVMKRSRDQIISQILGICAHGANKTRIVYQANLNFKTVNPYIELLTKNGLIDVNKDLNVYETTKRGAELLEDLKAIQIELYYQENLTHSYTKGVSYPQSLVRFKP
jgi:predicted transcriptional regulator